MPLMAVFVLLSNLDMCVDGLIGASAAHSLPVVRNPLGWVVPLEFASWRLPA